MTAHGLDAPDALTDGAWQPDKRGVLRWIPAPPTPAVIARQTPLLIACPKCLARIGQACRTPCGTATAAHSARIVSRFCPCGERLAARRRLCPTCRRQARLDTFKTYDVRRWPRDRRVA